MVDVWNPASEAFTAAGGPASVCFGTLSIEGRGDGADIDRVSLTKTRGTSAVPELSSQVALLAPGSAVVFLTASSNARHTRSDAFVAPWRRRSPGRLFCGDCGERAVVFSSSAA